MFIKKQDGTIINSSPKAGKIAGAIIAAIVILIILFSSFTVVPTGYTGVRTTFGQISKATVPQGFNFKIPFVQSIELVNNKQQDVTISTQVWGETIEKTPVYASNISVTYQISGAKSAWIFANVTNSDKNLISEDIVASAIKSAMVNLGTEDVTNRTVIEPATKEQLILSLNEKYGEGTVSVLKVIVGDMDFEESYNNAIAEKSIAQKAQEKQIIENETAVAKAEADKKVKITNAEAEAEAKRIESAAEADANNRISASLSDAVLKSKFYDKWNGELPQVMGENSTILDVTP